MMRRIDDTIDRCSKEDGTGLCFGQVELCLLHANGGLEGRRSIRGVHGYSCIPFLRVKFLLFLSHKAESLLQFDA